jgi:hypothetical protein
MEGPTPRFKIDMHDGYAPFGLYARTWMGWRKLDYFRTREEALVLYEKIKDLPEYLP